MVISYPGVVLSDLSFGYSHSFGGSRPHDLTRIHSCYHVIFGFKNCILLLIRWIANPSLYIPMDGVDLRSYHDQCNGEFASIAPNRALKSNNALNSSTTAALCGVGRCDGPYCVIGWRARNPIGSLINLTVVSDWGDRAWPQGIFIRTAAIDRHACQTQLYLTIANVLRHELWTAEMFNCSQI